MLISFYFITALLFLFVSIIWSTAGGLNVLIKMIFIIMTLWATLMLLGQLAPWLAANGVRLI